jgi:deoxyribodipyrimidine photo-lyase
MTAIWWIRRDLRLLDNPALHAAMIHGGVIPLFILDPHLIDRTSLRRQQFLWSGLARLDSDLRSRGSQLIIRTGDPLTVLRDLTTSIRLSDSTSAYASVSPIYAEEDFTPYARARDARIAKELPLKLIHGQTVHHPLVVLKPNGQPYTVYTPYSKTWKALLPSQLTPLPAPKNFPVVQFPSSEPLPHFEESSLFPAGEAEAQKRLAQFIHSSINAYSDHRNRLDLDGTSSLSPYIRFGMISLRQAASAALHNGSTGQTSNGSMTWLNELIWREFYIAILYHFPHVSQRAFNPALQNIAWRNDAKEFDAWKRGMTGVPVVDAAMRQLNHTGWMHNRARMITASYLVKDLLIDWRWGERYFIDQLLDGDPAANNGGWQWTAGTGTDAAPYFRIFNPILQSIKFDPEGNYIRKWIPELAHLDSKSIHAPWEKGINVKGYPDQPIITRDKDRTLRAYQLAKESVIPKYETTSL